MIKLFYWLCWKQKLNASPEVGFEKALAAVQVSYEVEVIKLGRGNRCKEYNMCGLSSSVDGLLQKMSTELVEIKIAKND